MTSKMSYPQNQKQSNRKAEQRFFRKFREIRRRKKERKSPENIIFITRMAEKKKRIAVSVINDLVTDQRVSRTCHELDNMGYEVLLIGRKLPNSLPMPKVPYQTKRMNL